MNAAFQFSSEVKDAIEKDKPIVALESTIIAHGMPFPQNLEVATEVQNVVREYGAVPATICIINGEILIGLEQKQLEKFAQATEVMKCSRRDLPYVISRKLSGATTVSATMMIADRAGIEVFATGGIGGVHRGAEINFDISADLIEFTQSRVLVVSAGAKAILDLPKTIEYLESLGVPVIGFGTEYFPAFYTRSSGVKVPMCLNTPAEVAAFKKANQQLDMKGILLANPIPEEFQLETEAIEKAINRAVAEAAHADISGNELTPFLLKKLNEVTGGKSQMANRALVLNNARVAAQTAVELKRI